MLNNTYGRKFMKKIIADLINLNSDSGIISVYEKEEIEKYVCEIDLKEECK